MPAARLTSPEVELNHPAEVARHVYMPTQVYPLFEQALRHRSGRSIDDHLVLVSELWSRFAAVAAGNPHAWIRDGMSAEQIRTPSATNRWVCWPYTKLMNANDAVEQAAALIACSAERAEALGGVQRRHGARRPLLVLVLASCLLDDGRRAWAGRDDEATLAEMRSGAEQIGRSVKIDPAGTLLL